MAAAPTLLFGSMQPGWNTCSADLARKTFATQLPYEALLPSEMHYRWVGNPTAPVLVMLHGLDAASVTFDTVTEALGTRYRLLLVDQRGHGKTPDRGLDYWPATLADDLLALTQSLGVKRFHLLGHSFGARTAIRVVERAPRGTVQSFIAVDMSFESRLSDPIDGEVVAQLLRQADGRRRAYESLEFDRDWLVEDFAERMLRGNFQAAESLVTRRTMPLSDGRVRLLYRPWVSSLYGGLCAADDTRDVLANVAIPVLDLRADPAVDTAHAGGPAIGPSKVVTIAGAGHVIHRARPDAFVREVLAFLDGVSDSQPMTAPAFSPVADLGTTPDPASRTLGLLPRGSALVTSSGALAKTGITHVVHAATGSSRQTGGAFDPTMESVRLSTLNSLSLAKQVGGKRVALPFVGGRIFLGRIGTTPEALAETLVQAALDGRGDLEVTFVLVDEAQATLFRGLLAKHGAPATVRAVVGNIVAFASHGADVIVNAANTEVVFGDGVSGAIGRATNAIEAIDDEARRAIVAYYASH